MPNVNSIHTLVIPLVEARDQSLHPDDIFKLIVKDLKFSTGVETENPVTADANSNVLVGSNSPDKVPMIKAVYVPINVSKRMLDLKGTPILVRDKVFRTYGGIVSKVEAKRTVQYPDFAEVTLYIDIDSRATEVIPPTTLRRSSVDIIGLADE